MFNPKSNKLVRFHILSTKTNIYYAELLRFSRIKHWAVQEGMTVCISNLYPCVHKLSQPSYLHEFQKMGITKLDVHSFMAACFVFVLYTVYSVSLPDYMVLVFFPLCHFPFLSLLLVPLSGSVTYIHLCRCVLQHVVQLKPIIRIYFFCSHICIE